MKFTSLDDLVEYLKHEDIKISDLEFKKAGSKDSSKKDDKEESKESNDKKEVKENYSSDPTMVAKIRSFSGDPEIPLEESDQNILYVSEFSSIPNSCHMGQISLLEREVYAGICTEEEDSKLDLVIEYVDSNGQLQTISDTFLLRETPHNTSEKLLLNSQR